MMISMGLAELPFVNDQPLPNVFFIFIAFHDAIIVGSGHSGHGFKIRMLNDVFQWPRFKIDFLLVFFNQGDDETKSVVVFGDVHAVGKAAGMNRTVCSNVDGPGVEGFAICIAVFFSQPLPGFVVYVALDFQVDGFWLSADSVVVPGGNDHKSTAADVSGQRFSSLNLVLVMLEENKFPESGPSSGCKGFYVPDDRVEIRTSPIQGMRIRHAVQGKNHAAAAAEKTSQSFPPGSVLKGAVGVAFHQKRWIDSFEVSGNIGKLLVGAQIAEISGERYPFQTSQHGFG
jgi:hypothetical protein